MSKFIDDLTGEQLYVAYDLDGGDLLGVVWAKSESEAYDYFNNDEPMIPDQLDRLTVELAEDSGYSIEELLDEFPDIFEEDLTCKKDTTDKLAESVEPDLYEMIAARAMHYMHINYNMDYQEIADELGIDVQIVLDLIGQDPNDDYDDSSIMLENQEESEDLIEKLDPKKWPDDKVLTYEEALELAKAYYAQGGDGFYETTEKYQFDDMIKDFGPMTVKKLKQDFGIFDSVCRDRMTESYRRIVSRGKTLDENELCVDVE